MPIFAAIVAKRPSSDTFMRVEINLYYPALRSLKFNQRNKKVDTDRIIIKSITAEPIHTCISKL